METSPSCGYSACWERDEFRASLGCPIGGEPDYETLSLEAVTVTGPYTLSAGHPGTYRAAVLPITSSLPMTYTWDNGTVGPTAAYSWTVPTNIIHHTTAELQSIGENGILALCSIREADETRSVLMKLRVIVHEAEEGGYWAEVPAIPGCATQGETFEELLQNLYEAVEGCLSVDIEQVQLDPQDRLLEIAV